MPLDAHFPCFRFSSPLPVPSPSSPGLVVGTKLQVEEGCLEAEVEAAAWRQVCVPEGLKVSQGAAPFPPARVPPHPQRALALAGSGLLAGAWVLGSWDPGLPASRPASGSRARIPP